MVSVIPPQGHPQVLDLMDGWPWMIPARRFHSSEPSRCPQPSPRCRWDPGHWSSVASAGRQRLGARRGPSLHGPQAHGANTLELVIQTQVGWV